MAITMAAIIFLNFHVTPIIRMLIRIISPPNGSLDGVLLYRCGGGSGRFLEMARNDTSSGAMKLKLCTGILNGSEGHL